MISSTTINTSSSSRHTVYNILIWNFNIDRIINLLSHLSKCTIKCLCLWNCTRESIKYISILTIFLVYSVYNEINNQFIRNQNDAAVGKKGGRPRKSPAETPVSEAETTERNETEPDGTGQDGTEPDETESDRTGGGDGSAGGRFVPPTLDEVRAYVLQRRSPVEPQAFIDFYQARGWMVGKAPMRDWKAACRSAESWERWSRPPAQTQVTNPDRIAKYVDW